MNDFGMAAMPLTLFSFLSFFRQLGQPKNRNKNTEKNKLQQDNLGLTTW